MITRQELMLVLSRLAPSRWRAFDFRRVGGRVVRFVAWNAKPYKNYGCAEVRHA